MSLTRANRPPWRSLALGVCALLVAGCAGLPRIDPTGERILIWPQNQPAVLPPGTGSVQAPPVFTDPVFPSPTLPATVGPAPVTGPIAVAPAAAPILAGVAAPTDVLTITPDRVLAPVGTEVILRAGICTTEKFLLTDQKVEWLVARESTGQIVELGGKGCCRTPLLPWNKPQKVDNHYAIGYTAKMPLLITRGTADPSDDVKIEPGHSWATITSPVEGISHVTAVTSVVDSWTARRATATIYWVDVAWTFPPPQISASGSQVMCTTVRRQTDGAPLVGWVVRYEVAGGGTVSGGQAGQVVEVATGADGRASIDVTPTGTSGNITQINMELVRPAGLGGPDFPRLVVSRSASTINWTTGQSTPYLPELDTPTTSSPAIPQPDRDPPLSTQPIEAAPAGRPALDLEIRGQSQVEVGSQTRFEVVIRNDGNGEATGIVLKSRYDQGLSHRMDRNKSMEVENSAVGNLGPGQSKSVFLDFDVLSSGRLCHNVTVRCNEGSETSKRACVNAMSPAPQGRAELDVKKDGPRQATVGEVALFTIIVKNTGEVPLTNVEIVDEYDRSLNPRPTRQGYEIVNGAIVWRVPRLEVGASEKFEVQCTCLTPTNRAGGLVKATDDTPLLRVDDHYIEVLPRRDAAGGGDVAPPQAGTLRLEIVSFANPVRAGASASYRIIVANRGQTPEEQVQLRVLFPPELAPNVDAVRNDANVRSTQVGNELRFDPIAQVRADERLEFVIPVFVNQPGVVNIVAQVTSRTVTQAVEDAEAVEILGR